MVVTPSIPSMSRSVLLTVTFRLSPSSDQGRRAWRSPYLKAEQTAELAVIGIRMLTKQLPQETAQKVEAALEKYPHGRQASVEEMLVNVGSLGGVIHHGTSGPPGCCVMINGHLVCVRAEASHA
jgi:hypothetical protein